MNSTILRIVVLIVVATFGIKVFAHARLKQSGALMPRSNSAGLKVGPCGNAQPLPNPAVYPPGAAITVNWEETVDHPGRFEFYFSATGDNDIQAQPLAVVQDNQNGGGLPHQYSTTLTLPSGTCTNCVLQMVQVMTESNPPSYYFSCADLKIQVGAPNPSPTPSPAPAPAPTPGPGQGCH